jgi:cell division protein FtsB
MSANSYWIDDRLRSQRVATRTLPNLGPARDISRNIVGTRTEVRRRGGIIPSWVVFGIIILGTSALCVNVTIRSVAEAGSAATNYEKMSSDVQKLREVNTNLEQEVRRLNTDSRAIETAARLRLNMVRANEIVLPAE